MDDSFEQSFMFIATMTEGVSSHVEIILSCLIMLVLLALSALLSGSEVAYFSLSPADKEEIEQEKVKAFKSISSLLDRPKNLLATILIANNFVNVGIVILSSFIAEGLMPSSLSLTSRFVIQVIVVTFLLLLLGEVIPKIYANRSPLKLANFMALPLSSIRTVLMPFSSLLVSSTTFIDKRIKKKGHNISVDELSQALDLTAEEGEGKETQKDHQILKGIVNFGNTDVKQVMTSRVDVTCIDSNQTYPEVLATILDSGYSRIPVFEENFDNVLGILYIKDLLPHLNQADLDWRKLIRKPFFVPEGKKIDDLLREFQTKKIHLAVVVDEYGGSSGIISLEDILEEIVGEISDEFDDDDLTYSKLDDYNYVFEGKIALNDMYRVLDIDGEEFDAEKGEAETLAGLVLELFGKIPKKNEKMRLNDYQISIEAADRRRVKRIKLTIPVIRAEK